jgi:hypothetical protein
MMIDGGVWAWRAYPFGSSILLAGCAAYTVSKASVSDAFGAMDLSGNRSGEAGVETISETTIATKDDFRVSF